MLQNKPKYLSFDNNSLVAALFGEHDSHLHKLEENLGVSITSRGNVICINGDNEKVEITNQILESLYTKLAQGREVNMSDVDAAIRMVLNNDNKTTKDSLFEEEIIIKTTKKQINPHSNRQKDYIRALYSKDLVFANGPAGTGKTYLAVAVAVSLFLSHRVEKLVLVRPAVEAGEKIGFLPGDMKEKVDPYMQPLYDALYDMLPSEKVQKYLESRIIEIAPLAFMRGRTLKDSFVILDEAQNTTPMQMKMFLTRLGDNSRMVINGDLSQIDLPGHLQSGLDDALNKLRNIDEIGYVTFTDEDIVRHSLVAKIVKAYKDN